MPHVEIKYSNDIELNYSILFDAVESTINQLDSSAGACKSRAYPAVSYKHSHIIVDVWLLPKPHRNQAFNKLLLEQLQAAITDHTRSNYYISLQIHYRDANYRTME